MADAMAGCWSAARWTAAGDTRTVKVFCHSIITWRAPACLYIDGIRASRSQVIFALPAEGDTDYSMRIFNSDGSEPEMCGNGIRCLARFIAQRDGSNGSTAHRVHTLAGQ